MSDLVLIDVVNGHLRAAVLRDGEVDDLFLAPLDEPATAGNVYLGRVRRILSGLNGAFVDIGIGTDAFLRASAARYADRFGPSNREQSRGSEEERPRIGDFVTEGQAVVVQVARPGVDDKGPMVTTELSLPGRYVVLKGCHPTLSLSRRIADEQDREELTDAMTPMLDGDVGWIVRTAALNVDDDAIVAEAQELKRIWGVLSDQAGDADALGAIHVDLPPLARVLREIELEPEDEILVAGEAGLDTVRDRVNEIWPDLAEAIRVDLRPQGLFHVEDAVEALAPFLESEVDIPGGGSLAIEKTRALTAIDVDTGSRSGGQRNPIVETNLAAADEIARQLRVRNVSGLIVVDFINMRRRQDRDQVVEALRDACAADRVAVQVLGLSPFGLVEMSRERNAYAALDDVMAPE